MPEQTAGANPADANPSGMNPGDEAAPGTPGTGEDICPDCHGSGQLRGGACPACGGTGKIVQGNRRRLTSRSLPPARRSPSSNGTLPAIGSTNCADRRDPVVQRSARSCRSGSKTEQRRDLARRPRDRGNDPRRADPSPGRQGDQGGGGQADRRRIADRAQDGERKRPRMGQLSDGPALQVDRRAAGLASKPVLFVRCRRDRRAAQEDMPRRATQKTRQSRVRGKPPVGRQDRLRYDERAWQEHRVEAARQTEAYQRGRTLIDQALGRCPRTDNAASAHTHRPAKASGNPRLDLQAGHHADPLKIRRPP